MATTDTHTATTTALTDQVLWWPKLLVVIKSQTTVRYLKQY